MMVEQRIPDWQLERYRLGELPAEEAASVSQALAAEASARERLEALRADDARTLAEHPAAVLAAGIRARISRDRDAASAWPAQGALARLAPLLSAVAVVFALSALLPFGRDPEAPPETRLKGLAPSLLVFRNSAAGAEPLAPAAAARADDVVQLVYQAAGKRYGVVVSIDGRGRVTRHLPPSGDQAALLQSGAPVALPEAYRLDDAPGFERFFLITANAPFSVEAVVRATQRLYGGGPDPARTGTRLELPAGLDQFRFELRKEGPR